MKAKFICGFTAACALYLASSAHAQTANCNAPPAAATHLKAAGTPTCEQQWAYELYRRHVIKFWPIYGSIIDAGISREEAEQEFWDLAIDMTSMAVDLPELIVKNKVHSKWMIEQYAAIMLQLAPDDPRAQQIAGRWADVVVKSWSFATDKMGRMRLDQIPEAKDVIFDAAKLVNDSISLTKTQQLAAKRKGLLVAQEYLAAFYQAGGDDSAVARNAGLGAKASRAQILVRVSERLVGDSRGRMNVAGWIFGYTDFAYAEQVSTKAQEIISRSVAVAMGKPAGPVATTPIPPPSPPPAPAPPEGNSGLSPAGSELVAALAGLGGRDRYDLLISMSLHKRAPGPYTPNDVDAILAGMESLRLDAVKLLASRLVGPLSSQDVSQLLRGLEDQRRYEGLVSLSLHRRLADTYSTGDVNTIVAGMGPREGQARQMLLR